MVDTTDSSLILPRRLEAFAGVWSLERCITPAKGLAGRFEGTAHWVPENGGLAYSEQGFLTLEGQPPMQAERRYFWDADLNVFFEDGRFFHQVPPEGGTAAHWCAPDQYDVRYDFADWPVFEVRWKVVGPRKDYEMISTYRRE